MNKNNIKGISIIPLIVISVFSGFGTYFLVFLSTYHVWMSLLFSLINTSLITGLLLSIRENSVRRGRAFKPNIRFDTKKKKK